MVTLEFILNNVLAALMRIHVRGEDAGILDGVIQNLKLALEAIEQAEKEGKADEA